MSPEDEALIAKAALLGCPFKIHNGRYYTKLAIKHPLSKRLQEINGGLFGQTDPIVLAREWVEYFTEHPHETI